METYIELLEKLIRLRPVSENVSAVNQVQETICAFLQERGICCTMEILDGRKILYASTVPGKNPDLLINAHVDVVPVEDDSQFEPVIRDGWMYARGANDCLGSAVCIIKALCEADKSLSIGAVFSADEEIGGATTGYMADNGYTARRLVCVLDGPGDKITYAQKGTMNVRLSASGISGHASAPFDFDNAADKLIAGYSRFKADWRNPANGECWQNSMALTIVRAGIIANKIPDSAEMIVNFRFISPEAREEILQALRDKTQLEVELLSFRDPVIVSKDAPELAILAACMEKQLGFPPPFNRMLGATDASYFVKGSAPVIILGLNSLDAHGRNERLKLDSISQYAEIFKQTAALLK